MQEKLTWKKAIRKVLREADRPLHYEEIAERIISSGLISTKGKTPERTVSTELTKHMFSEVVRTGPGRYRLTENTESEDEPLTQASSTIGEIDFQLPTFSKVSPSKLWVDDEWLKRLHMLLEEKKQVVFYGPPGTGKTFLARSLAEELAEVEQQIKLVQFHPSYGYEDFFEGYRPTGNSKGEIALELKHGPLRELAALAEQDTTRPYFLIIDEINRGELSRIFGECYFLLEYRTQSIRLMYSGEDFSLPENLYIIGTMNSADRSIAMVDTAMRRRFAFIELHPHKEPTRSLLGKWANHESISLPIVEIWEELNRRIIAIGGNRDYLIGPAYFMRNSETSEMWLTTMWETEVLPLLHEIFIDDHDLVLKEFSLENIRRSLAPNMNV